VLGLVVVVFVKGHKLELVAVGDGGLGGRILNDLKADTALV
jgi:hypothetical protein